MTIFTILPLQKKPKTFLKGNKCGFQLYFQPRVHISTVMYSFLEEMLAFVSEHLVAVVSTSVAALLALALFCLCPRRPKEQRETGS